MFAGAPVD
jgi:hypothetical protein